MTGWRKWTFVLFMLALTGLFLGLGLWQLTRLEEKQALIATVAERLATEPVPFPAAERWGAEVGTGDFDYRAVTVTGRYLPHDTVLVFTSLSSPKGELRGPGYWVMTPLVLESGGAMWVNRGFIPESARSEFAGGGTAEQGGVTLTGIAKPSEQGGAFTPAANEAERIDWIRNVDRLSRLAPDLPQPVAPVYLDLPADPPGTLPQSGETVVNFPNNHLGYALTWFGFAILTPILLIFWLRRQRPAVSS
jgi:surfeit locus 1 family protein